MEITVKFKKLWFDYRSMAGSSFWLFLGHDACCMGICLAYVSLLALVEGRSYHCMQLNAVMQACLDKCHPGLPLIEFWASLSQATVIKMGWSLCDWRLGESGNGRQLANKWFHSTPCHTLSLLFFNTFRQQNGHRYADNISKINFVEWKL